MSGVDKARQIFDLSLPLENGMPSFPSPNHRVFSRKKLADLRTAGRETSAFEIGSHCGTHMDAPKHFIEGSNSIEQIPLGRVCGEALLINLGTLPPCSIINPEILSKQIRGKKTSRILIRTDWSRFWGTSQYFDSWPCLTLDCAELLLENKIAMLGLDFPSPDPYCPGDDRSKDSPVHKLLLGNGTTIIEYLCSLDKLKPGRIFFIGLPLKIVGADGSPIRAAGFNL